MDRMSETLILSLSLKKWQILMFYIVLNFKELFMSPQPDVRLIWGLDQNVAFKFGQVKSQNWI